MPSSRKALLREAIADVVESMMQRGMMISKGMTEVYDEAVLRLTTQSEVASLFGVTGFVREIVRPVMQERGRDGHRKFEFNAKSRRYFQTDMADLGDLTWAYCHKFNNASSVHAELVHFYEMAQQRFGDAFASQVPHPDEVTNGAKVQIPDED